MGFNCEAFQLSRRFFSAFSSSASGTRKSSTPYRNIAKSSTVNPSAHPFTSTWPCSAFSGRSQMDSLDAHSKSSCDPVEAKLRAQQNLAAAERRRIEMNLPTELFPPHLRYLSAWDRTLFHEAEKLDEVRNRFQARSRTSALYPNIPAPATLSSREAIMQAMAKRATLSGPLLPRMRQFDSGALDVKPAEEMISSPTPVDAEAVHETLPAPVPLCDSLPHHSAPSVIVQAQIFSLHELLQPVSVDTTITETKVSATIPIPASSEIRIDNIPKQKYSLPDLHVQQHLWVDEVVLPTVNSQAENNEVNYVAEPEPEQLTPHDLQFGVSGYGVVDIPDVQPDIQDSLTSEVPVGQLASQFDKDVDDLLSLFVEMRISNPNPSTVLVVSNVADSEVEAMQSNSAEADRPAMHETASNSHTISQCDVSAESDAESMQSDSAELFDDETAVPDSHEDVDEQMQWHVSAEDLLQSPVVDEMEYDSCHFQAASHISDMESWTQQQSFAQFWPNFHVAPDQQQTSPPAFECQDWIMHQEHRSNPFSDPFDPTTIPDADMDAPYQIPPALERRDWLTVQDTSYHVPDPFDPNTMPDADMAPSQTTDQTERWDVSNMPDDDDPRRRNAYKADRYYVDDEFNLEDDDDDLIEDDEDAEEQ